MNTMRTVLLMTLLTLVLVAAGGALGGRSGALFALIMAAAMNLGSYWFSDKIVIKDVSLARRPKVASFTTLSASCASRTEPHHAESLCAAAADAQRLCYRPQSRSMPWVAATQGIVEILRLPSEAEGGHGARDGTCPEPRHPDRIDSGPRLPVPISFMAQMAQWSMIFGGRDDEDKQPDRDDRHDDPGPDRRHAGADGDFPLPGNMVPDAKGARLCGNPHALASALRKLEQANQRAPMQKVNAATAHMFIVNPLRAGNRLANLFSTHPADGGTDSSA